MGRRAQEQELRCPQHERGLRAAGALRQRLAQQPGEQMLQLPVAAQHGAHQLRGQGAVGGIQTFQRTAFRRLRLVQQVPLAEDGGEHVQRGAAR